jgi:hypothetical protein
VIHEWDPDVTSDSHYDEIKSLCRELDLPVIDTFMITKDFAAENGLASADLALDAPNDWHPNPLRHILMAKAAALAISGPEINSEQMNEFFDSALARRLQSLPNQNFKK